MTETKHTRGPWVYDESSGSIRGANGEYVDNSATLSFENKADLALILASPDLLAACEMALEEFQHSDRCSLELGDFSCGCVNKLKRNFIVAAIAKAKGEK